MPDTVVDDRRATAAELVAHRDALLELARARGLLNLRVQDDGVLFVTSVHPGYLKVASFTNVASELVGAYVYVITDDTPGVEAGGIRL